jgi:raffinose/stachyose/melibiose transport system permease protein
MTTVASDQEPATTSPGGEPDEHAGRSSRPGAQSPRRRHISPGRLVSYAFVLVIMVMYLFPLGFLINTALKSTAGFYSDPVGLTTSPNFGNFAQAWQKGHFGAYFLNSVMYTGVAAILNTVVSLVVGFPVSRGYVRHRRLWYGVFVAMLFLPNALMTQFQLVLRLNLYDTALGYILIMASGLGVGPLLLVGYMKSIPKEMDEAAALDGVGYWRFLFTFLPPLIKPVLATIFILQAIGVWNDIILATILLPSPEKSPLTLGLFAFQGTYSSQWGLLAAATMIVAAPLVVAYVFLQKYLVGGVAGSVKG